MHPQTSAMALCAALALLGPAVARPAPAAGEAAVPPDLGRSYAQPHRLVDVGGGRRLNLDCRGRGPVTVVFDAGLSDWSSTWALVQPKVAAFARACAYDRAGMGFSNPAARPSTPATIVEDLHALLGAAKLHKPLILVGHSMGGFNMKLYAATYPAEVSGLVLVDPSEERLTERGAAAVAELGADAVAKNTQLSRVMFGAYSGHLKACAEAARTQDLDPNSGQYKSCTDPARPSLGPEIAASRAALQVRYAYLAAQASELANGPFAVDPQTDAQYARAFAGVHPFGDKPLIVLDHSIVSPSDQFVYQLSAAAHRETAGLSTGGEYRVIPDTHHNIEIDQPEAVVDAVREVVMAVVGTRR